MEILEEKMYQLLKNIAEKRTKEFSGLGIVVYDENILSEECHCDLRPNFKFTQINIDNTEIVDKLIEYSDYRCNLHDGFCFMNQSGDLTHVAQYYVPSVRKEIFPNQEHGVRTYSAACGSMMEGVKFIGLISSNNDIYIYKEGKEFINDSKYIKREEE